MKPVDQTTFGVPGGNCFSACVASLLELPIEDVPYFMGADDWNKAFDEWLRPRGFYAVFLRLRPVKEDPWRPAGLYVLGGQCVRGPHAVVARGNTIVHDPHPSRGGVDTWEDATLIVPLDPAQEARRA